jgi:hypothetical protein
MSSKPQWLFEDRPNTRDGSPEPYDKLRIREAQKILAGRCPFCWDLNTGLRCDKCGLLGPNVAEMDARVMFSAEIAHERYGLVEV